MFIHKLAAKRNRRIRVQKIDVMEQQVRKMLTNENQRLILMVRG
jgi:hypothetical protein